MANIAFALRQKYADVLVDKFSLTDVVITFCEMRHFSTSARVSDAQDAARRLLKRVEGAETDAALGPVLSVIPTMRREAQSLLSIAHAGSNAPDPYRKYGRNQRVTVQYGNGPAVTRKFKYVEGDLRSGRCTFVHK